MLSAILRGKAGHWFENGHGRNGEPWRRAIRIEDSLTAMTFDLLASLSGRTIAAILGSACIPAIDVGWIGQDDFTVEFWPRVGDNVEPDVVILDEDAMRILVVESKLGSLQSGHQLASELAAVRAEWPKYDVQILAVGGDNVYDAVSQLKRADGWTVDLAAMSWRSLSDTVGRSSDAAASPSERRCLGLLRAGLDWFGWRTPPAVAFDAPPPSREAFEAVAALSWVAAPAVIYVTGEDSRWLRDLEGRLPSVTLLDETLTQLKTWRLVHG